MRRARYSYVRKNRNNPFDEDQTSSNELITPYIGNMTIGPVPPDKTNIVRASANELGLSDKLNALIEEYRTEIIIVPSTGRCASDITAKVPRNLLSAIFDALNVNNNNCKQETATLLQTITGLLSSTTDDYIPIKRNFWTTIGRVFFELCVDESTVNCYGAIVRAMSSAITTDVQALPTNDMLISSMDRYETLADMKIDMLDDDFLEQCPEAVKPQPDMTEVVSTVINELPTSVGDESTFPATSIVDVDASTGADNVQLYDLDKSDSIQGQAYQGLKELFSTNNLTTTLRKLKFILGPTIECMVQKQITFVINTGTAEAPKFENATETFFVYQKEDAALLDLNKSMLDQDWALAVASNSRSTVEWIPIHEFNPRTRSADETFIGLNSQRVYSLAETRGLKSVLNTAWNKMVNMKLPSVEHITMATDILKLGMGTAGQFFGSAGLIKASQLTGALSAGLSIFAKPIDVDGIPTPTAQSSIEKNALSVVPSVADAGKSQMEAISEDAQNQRMNLSSRRNQIENNYATSSPSLATRMRVSRVRSRLS